MTKQTAILARGLGVIGATAALITGITFADLATSVTLTDNTISTATANLLVWDGDSFETTATGFHMTNLVPGTPQSAPFYLKNAGGVALALTAQASAASPTNGMGADKVHITIKDDSTTDAWTGTLADLQANPQLFDTSLGAGDQGNSGVAGTSGNYTVTVNIAKADVPAGGTSVPSFTITIAGTQTP